MKSVSKILATSGVCSLLLSVVLGFVLPYDFPTSFLIVFVGILSVFLIVVGLAIEVFLVSKNSKGDIKTEAISKNKDKSTRVLIILIFAIPISAYLFGYIYGKINGM